MIILPVSAGDAGSCLPLEPEQPPASLSVSVALVGVEFFDEDDVWSSPRVDPVQVRVIHVTVGEVESEHGIASLQQVPQVCAAVNLISGHVISAADPHVSENMLQKERKRCLPPAGNVY